MVNVCDNNDKKIKACGDKKDKRGAFQIVVVRHCERSETIQSYKLRVTFSAQRHGEHRVSQRKSCVSKSYVSKSHIANRTISHLTPLFVIFVSLPSKSDVTNRSIRNRSFREDTFTVYQFITKSLQVIRFLRPRQRQC